MAPWPVQNGLIHRVGKFIIQMNSLQMTSSRPPKQILPRTTLARSIIGLETWLITYIIYGSCEANCYQKLALERGILWLHSETLSAISRGLGCTMEGPPGRGSATVCPFAVYRPRKRSDGPEFTRQHHLWSHHDIYTRVNLLHRAMLVCFAVLQDFVEMKVNVAGHNFKRISIVFLWYAYVIPSTTTVAAASVDCWARLNDKTLFRRSAI